MHTARTRKPLAASLAGLLALVGLGATAQPASAAPPPASSCIAADPSTDRRVALDWADAPGATSYQVWEDAYNGTPNLVGTVTASQRTSGVLAAGTYRYFVRPVNADGVGPDSPKVTVSVPAETPVSAPAGCNPLVPPAPTGLVGSEGPGEGGLDDPRTVRLNWDDSAGYNPTRYSPTSGDHYRLYLGDMFVSDATASAYETPAAPGTYTYSVSVVIDGRESPRSAPVTVTVGQNEPAPVLAAPTNLTAVEDPAGRATLDWDDYPGFDADDTYRWRETNTPAGATVSPTASQRVSGNLADGTYEYAVQAVIDGVATEWSSVAVVTIDGTADTVTPPPPPADRAPQVPASAALLWDGSWDTGDFAQWKVAQNRYHNGSAATHAGEYPLTLTTTDVREGSHAGRFEVRDGDVPEFGGGERSEVEAPDVVDIVPGDERWYEFSLKFGEGFVCEAPFFIVTQWHAGSGSPPLALTVDGSCNLRVSNLYGTDIHRTIGRVVPGRWMDVVLHAQHSTSTTDGRVEAWVDGQNTMPWQPFATMADGGSYMKQGIYRGGDAVSTAVLTIDGTRVFDS